ncbi:MAG: VPLPA-CTERM sorting domain-containing protein [Gammaproteobacteria bacterium]
MNFKKLKLGLVALTLGLTGQMSYANVIGVAPTTSTIGVGQEITLDITMEFLQETVGGSFDIFYDTNIFDVVSFSYDATFSVDVIDPAFTLTPENCETDGSAIGGCSVGDAELNAVGFGNFDGIIGDYVIGQLTLVATNGGLGTIGTASSDSPFGGFISAADASEMIVVYNGASVLVVPVPAAIWLMLSALGIMGGLRRR